MELYDHQNLMLEKMLEIEKFSENNIGILNYPINSGRRIVICILSLYFNNQDKNTLVISDKIERWKRILRSVNALILLTTPKNLKKKFNEFCGFDRIIIDCEFKNMNFPIVKALFTWFLYPYKQKINVYYEYHKILVNALNNKNNIISSQILNFSSLFNQKKYDIYYSKRLRYTDKIYYDLNIRKISTGINNLIACLINKYVCKFNITTKKDMKDYVIDNVNKELLQIQSNLDECPILYSPLDDDKFFIVLTCCRKVISLEAMKKIDINKCPFCMQKIKFITLRSECLEELKKYKLEYNIITQYRIYKYYKLSHVYEILPFILCRKFDLISDCKNIIKPANYLIISRSYKRLREIFNFLKNLGYNVKYFIKDVKKINNFVDKEIYFYHYEGEYINIIEMFTDIICIGLTIYYNNNHIGFYFNHVYFHYL